MEAIDRRIANFATIEDVVTSLRALSASQLRRVLVALQAVRLYELDLRSALASLASRALEPSFAPRMLTIVFGSEQGLCGALNRRVAEEALRRQSVGFLPIGSRLAGLIEGRSIFVARRAAESLASVGPLIADLTEDMERAVHADQIDGIEVVHPIRSARGAYSVGVTRLFPLDRTRLGVTERPIPLRLHEPEPIMVERFLFEWMHTALYWVALETQASIHSARLETSDCAVRAIQRRLGKLRLQRNRLRQEEITQEIQEVVAANEARQDDHSRRRGA